MAYEFPKTMKLPTTPNFIWMQVFISFCWVLAMGGSAVAQLSELRYSREPVPGLSDISLIGISVDMGPAPHLMNLASIIETLQPRLETLGYRVALAPTHSPDGLWLQVNCQGIAEKIDSRSRKGSQHHLAKNQVIAPPCQLAYTYQQEVIPWKHVDRLIYSESVATMKRIAKIARVLQPQECVTQFFHLYDFPVCNGCGMGTCRSVNPNPQSSGYVAAQTAVDSQVIR